MTRRVRVLPEADREIDEHIAFIARERPDAALRFLDSVTTIFDHIAAMPRMGGVRDYRKARLRGLRMIPVPGFENFLVFYLITAKTVDIVRVLHAARNTANMFSKQE